MISDNSPPTRETYNIKAGSHLEATGLAIEYFPEYAGEHSEFHTHKFVELLFLLSGTFQQFTGDKTHNESAGGLSIINYNQFHHNKVSDSPIEMMNIYWNPEKYPAPELPEPFSTRLHELIPSHPSLGHRLNRIVRIQFEDPEKITHLLHELLMEQEKKYPASESAINFLFGLLLIQICRNASITPKESEEEFNPRMEKIRLYLEQHYTEPVRLKQLCELSGLKETNLCQQFKKYTGLSIGNYLKQRRLAAAMQQLRTSSNKIITICYDCGFPEINHFNQTFRKVTGKTPSDYRKQFSPAEDG